MLLALQSPIIAGRFIVWSTPGRALMVATERNSGQVTHKMNFLVRWVARGLSRTNQKAEGQIQKAIKNQRRLGAKNGMQRRQVSNCRSGFAAF